MVDNTEIRVVENHVLEIQDGFIDINWIFNRSSKEAQKEDINGKVSAQ